MDSDLRRKLDAITAPYDPANPPAGPFWQCAARGINNAGLALLVFIVWLPILLGAWALL